MFQADSFLFAALARATLCRTQFPVHEASGSRVSPCGNVRREAAACCPFGCELFAKESRQGIRPVWHHHVPRDRREHDQGVHCVGTIHDEVRVVRPPLRRFSGEELENLTCRPSVGWRKASTFSTTSSEVRPKAPLPAHGGSFQGLPRTHKTDHVQDDQRARHERGDPGCSTHAGLLPVHTEAS